MKIALYIGALLGVALLVALAVRVDLTAMIHVLTVAGWPLLWLLPYRASYFLPYALGWKILLRGVEGAERASLGYLFWVTTVREAIDRLLPVASVGGGVAGVRLLRWRGLPAAPVGASIIVEILLTLYAVYLFFVVGVLLLFHTGDSSSARLLLALVLTVPVPLGTTWLLLHGTRFLIPMVGENSLSEGFASLDRAIRATLGRYRDLLVTGVLQFAALFAGSFEIWFVLRLFGHPVDWRAAIAVESLTQAVRHIAFVIPAGLGVQEAALIMFGRSFGIDAELALAVSMAKRVREVLLGVASLLSWQWMEGRRIMPRRDGSAGSGKIQHPHAADASSSRDS